MRVREALIAFVAVCTGLMYALVYLFGDPGVGPFFRWHYLPEVVALYGIGVLQRMDRVPRGYVLNVYLVTSLVCPVVLWLFNWYVVAFSFTIAAPYVAGYYSCD